MSNPHSCVSLPETCPDAVGYDGRHEAQRSDDDKVPHRSKRVLASEYYSHNGDDESQSHAENNQQNLLEIRHHSFFANGPRITQKFG